MAHELTDMVRKNKTIDWDKKVQLECKINKTGTEENEKEESFIESA